MDVYELSSASELILIDELLDFSNVNEDIFSSSSSSSAPPHHSFAHHSPSSSPFLSDFTHDLCVTSEEAAQLEWLSQFVDDSFSDFPANPLGGTMIGVQSDTPFSGKPRSKRSRATSDERAKPEREGGERHVSGVGMVRRCTHCASEKTPQWRTGPLGPKTLCNACGVRFKSGRLVPEYRPAASPTFVLTQHSNSHRKVMELRRQKELMRQQQHQQPFQPQ